MVCYIRFVMNSYTAKLKNPLVRCVAMLALVLPTMSLLGMSPARAAITVDSTYYRSGANPGALVYDGSLLWATSYDDAVVTATDMTSNTLVYSINVGSRSSGLCISPDNSTIWVTGRDGFIGRIDTYSGILTDSWTMDGQPISCATDGQNVWVTNYDYNSVSLYDASNDSWVNTITTGSGPWGITYDQNTQEMIIDCRDAANIEFYSTNGSWAYTYYDGQNTDPTFTIPVNGQYWTSNYSDYTIAVSDSLGNTLAQMNPTDKPYGLFYQNGVVWAALDNGSIAGFDPVTYNESDIAISSYSIIGVSGNGLDIYVSTGDSTQDSIRRVYVDDLLAAPTGLQVSRGVGSIVVSWQPVAGSSTYHVILAGGGTQRSVDLPNSSRSFGFTGVNNGIAYTVSVQGKRNGVFGHAAAKSVAALTKPQPPSIGTITLQNRAITLHWSPNGNGGLPITSFRATLSPGGISCVTASTACVLAGLTPGGHYVVTVTATSAMGTSSPSAPKVFTAATVPTAPLGVRVTASLRSFLVNFLPPANAAASAITSYQYSVNGGASWIAVPGGASARYVVITGLGSKVKYLVSIRAVSAIGGGAASAPVSKTTL